MPDRIVAPYGSWKSPITSDVIVQKTLMLGEPQLDGQDVYWLEGRPAEGGRYVLVRRTPDGAVSDVTPPGFNARTRVHEYGGAAALVRDGTVWFSNFADQRLYVQRPGAEPEPLSPPVDLRYANATLDAARQRLICVREDHTGEGEAVNSVVAMPLSGGAGDVLVSGSDFYAHPRLSPDGAWLAWLSWDHPRMPWDGTELWLAPVNTDGSPGDARLVAGGVDDAVFQPEWSPGGVLHFISDRGGWWNLYRCRDGHVEALHPKEADFGQPLWQLGTTTYAFDRDDGIVCTYLEQGISKLARVDLPSGKLQQIETPFTSITNVRCADGRAVFTAAGPRTPNSVVLLDLASGALSTLRQATDLAIDEDVLSLPEPIEFPTSNGLSAHAFYYPPANSAYEAPEGERPPLIVISHGGPTAATFAVLNPSVQFSTSRGIGVVDVNYGGSTGYGRDYRRRLNDSWGVVDLEDCVNAARYLAERGDADPERLLIRGGSAGGYTTLCALTFTDAFRAGASYYGVADAERLALDTHKFESRYLDSIIGPYPERKDLYIQRSPIHHTDQLSSPMIIFQGLEDEIVPPNQAEAMFEAVRAKGLPVAYLAFEGEQHGFRKAENIKRTLDAELYFYGKVLCFEPADEIEPVDIQNL
jgi:dipeptidyl aminopeptidase/acylaminoacyl peptidase